MKTYFPFVLFLTTFIFQQAFQSTLNAQKVTSYTVWASRNSSWMGESITDGKETAPHRSLEIGMGVEKHFRGNLSFQYGVGLVGRGSYLSDEKDKENRIKMSYVTIPFAVRKVLFQTSTFSVGYSLALVPAARLSASSLKDGVEAEMAFRRWDCGIRAGIGVQTFLDGRYSVGLDLFREQGVWKVSTTSGRFESDKRNLTVGLRLTIGLPFRYSEYQNRIMH